MKILTLFGMEYVRDYFDYSINKALAYTELLKSIDIFYLTLLNRKLELKQQIIYFDLVKSWSDFYRELDNLQKKYKFERIDISFLPAPVFRKQEDVHLDNNFLTIRNLKYFICKYLSDKYNIPIYHFVHDPAEEKIDVSNYNRFFYYEKEDSKYLPYIEYGYLFKTYKKQEIEKIYDFTFGGVNHYNSCRNDIFSELYGIDFGDLKYNLFLKDLDRNKANLIDMTEYNDNFILKSKFTLILPSIKNDEFSLKRFYDTVARECIPLIHESVQWEQAFFNKPKLKKVVGDLVINIKDIKNKLLDLDYTYIRNRIFETEIKDYFSESFYENYRFGNNNRKSV